LYLNKYPLDGRGCQTPLRLFVRQEEVDERVETHSTETGKERRVILTIRATQLALVHWQAAHAADPEEEACYFRDRWELEPPSLTTREDPWFRAGGHQSWLAAPGELLWVRSSSLVESAGPSDSD